MNLIDRLDRLAKDAAHGAFWNDEEFNELDQAMNAVRADRTHTKETARAALEELDQATDKLDAYHPATQKIRVAMILIRSLK